MEITYTQYALMKKLQTVVGDFEVARALVLSAYKAAYQPTKEVIGVDEKANLKRFLEG